MDTHTHWGDDHVKTEADSEVMLSQAKENLGLPELGGPRQEPALETLERA